MSQQSSRINIEQLRSVMDNSKNIRNMSIVAHVDHGKSTLADSLLAANGIINLADAGKKRATSLREDEQLRGITIKSTGVSLHYQMPKHLPLPLNSEGNEFLINLIDSPGHVDFSSEVTAALRLTDGALVLVDCVEGCCVQTETVLRQAMAERIKPVLAVNKIDRAFMELKLDLEEMYQMFNRWIDQVNGIISTYSEECLGDLTLRPENGTVAFSAGKQGWAFTLDQFARIYGNALGIDPSKLVKKLWGENYYDSETKKWTTRSTSASGKPLQRGFCKFILEPISQVFDACLNNKSALDKILKKINVAVKPEEMEQLPKDLLRTVMMRWLPASDAILEMVVTHLPSPAVAQKYRVENLYTGPLDDETSESIRSCNPKGPLVMYISKMLPTKDNSRFYAFGRVFSGTVSAGQKIRIMGANYEPGKKGDLFQDVPIQRVLIMLCSKTEAVESVPCGNTCALVGIDQHLHKTGTLTDNEKSFPLINMKYSVHPVVRVAVSAKHPSDLPKLAEALKRLGKTDPLVQITLENTGEHVVACAGALHMEICLGDLRTFMNGAEIVVSPPIVSYQETITAKSNKCLAKSPNSHNRLWVQAEPMDESLVKDLEEGDISAKDDVKVTAKKLHEKYNWDLTEARKIWSFGNNTNILVDGTKGIQYMNEIKDNVVVGFQWVTKRGVLAEEPLRGAKFSLVDATLHTDTVHRGPGQIIPASQRVFYGAQLSSKPRLVEPVYLVDIQCSQQVLSGVYNTLNQRRGLVIEASIRTGTPVYSVKAYLPVAESFDFTEFLRSQTSGQAFPQLKFDHWELIDEDPLQEGTKARTIMLDIRKRKGIEVDVPSLDRYLDKL